MIQDGKFQSRSTSGRLSRYVIRTLLPFAAAAVLVILILTHSLAAYFESVNPHWALALHSSEANAELHIATDRLAAGVDSGSTAASNAIDLAVAEDDAQLRDRIIRALYNEPLSGRGFELLGVLSATTDRSKTNIFMHAALDRSPRSPAALYWMMNRKRLDGEIGDSVALADTLLRIRPSTMSAAGENLAQIAGTEGGVRHVIAALRNAPPWRKSFFRFLGADIRNSRTAFVLLSGLRGSAHPPTNEEIDAYLWALTNRKEFELAYSAWLQFLSPEKAQAVGLLFNGSFQFAPTQVPFDWSIQGGSGVIAEIDHRGERPGENVLSLELGGGHVNFRPITQTLVLPTGRYRFSSKAKGELDGPRGLRWQIACLTPSSKTVSETPMVLGAISEWKEFSMRFDVPQGCAAQSLRLILDARSLSEALVSGSVSFADLKIARD